MIGYPEAPRAWWLTRGMARLLGLNLPQAVVDGWISRPELADMIGRCAACPSGSSCEGWLAARVSASALPGFCANKAALEALSPQH